MKLIINNLINIILIFSILLFSLCKSDNYNETPTSTGTLYGEFQDGTLFAQKSNENPDLQGQTAEQMWEGVTGATLQAITLQYQVPERKVIIEDSIVAISDGFGQFHCTLPSGKHTLTGTCDGYITKSQTIEIVPDTKNYVIIVLERNVR
jgi:hypothetical protein